ncbi:uncharacterized protein LOC111904649 [Lactuca sativa]|uniref:uncharacterized protein LOC111904649 n=1 Tax=Lactuca sativa TaxID=4236 RepID=UPI0022AE8D99|nr:uncharacterized protein LOC111904649 [Lactuca sativa]
MFGSEYRFQLYNSLNFFGEEAPLQNWMIMPDTGVLIASRYNMVLHCFIRHASTTYLPLRSTPPPPHERIVIAIGLVYGNHYVKLDLEGEYTMPPIAPQWIHCKRPCAAEWVTPYIERLNMYNHYYRASFNG